MLRPDPPSATWLTRPRRAVASFLRDLPDGRYVPRIEWRRRHRIILALLWGLIPAILGLALYGAQHPVLGLRFRAEPPLHLLVEFGSVALLAGVASVPGLSRRARGVSASLGFAALSALFVHLAQGLIEAHFLFLVGVAMISLYQDWLPLSLGAVLTVTHHIVVGVVEPTSVYNHPAALARPVQWALLHALFVSGIIAAEVFHWHAVGQQRAFTDRVVEGADEGLIGLDERGYVTFVNAAAERFVGAKDSLVRQPARKALEKALPGLAAADAFAAKAASDERLEGRGVRVMAEDGTMRFIDWTRVPMREKGAVIGWVVTIRDVTERHLAESRLREQELQLSAAQRLARVGSFEWAPVADVLRVSEEFVRIVDNARVERPPRFERVDDLLDCLHPEDVERVRAGLLRAHTHGHPFEVECRIGSEEDVRHCELRGQLDERLHPEGPQRLVRGSCHDVTERVRAEEMRRRSLEKDQEIQVLREQDTFKNRFINSVAHELNTPLTPVRLQLHVLKMDRERTLTPRQRRAVEMLERNVQRFSGLVEDLLDTARLQGGRLRVDPRPLDLREVVEEAVDHFEGVMLEKDLVLETEFHTGLVVQGDRDRLLQVVYNLLSNACQFTPRGGTIRVGAARTGSEVVLKVRDTGIGIAKSDQARLFQPFTQVQDPMEVSNAGTGLGLYLCRGLLALHGGRIWCESAGRGKGATFAFALPVAAEATGPVDASALSEEVRRAAGPWSGPRETVSVRR